MIKWCKTFDVEDDQIVFFYEIEEGSDNYMIHQIMMIDNQWYDVLLRNIPKDDIEQTFKLITPTVAKIVVDAIKELHYNKTEIKEDEMS